MGSTRRSTRTWLAVLVCLPLLALAAIADVLLAHLATAAGQPDGAQRGIAAQLQATEGTLFLATAAVAALAVALAWAVSHLGIVGRLESALRSVEKDLDLGPFEPGADELDRLVAHLEAYRRALTQERAQRESQFAVLQDLRGAADTVVAQLREADRLALVGRVAMGVAHEIGGPLAIVVGYLERLDVLERENADLEQRLRCVDHARHAAERIHAILSDFAQPGLPQSREADRPCDLVAVAVRVMGQCEQHPRASRLQLDIDAQEGQHPADASASHVEQVLMNLVVNAADATRTQGSRAVIVLRRVGDWQELAVDDDGPGIPAEDRLRIFDEFYTTKRAEPGQASRRSGWGLGLAVSKRIIAGYGGSLAADSGTLGGARMIVRLPLPGRLRKAAKQSGAAIIS